MTKEQRFYDLQLRNAELKVKRAELERNEFKREFEEIRDLYDDNIRTLDLLNDAQRKYQRAELAFKQAEIDLEEDRLRFLRDATHVTILEAKKYRTPNGRRQVEIVMQNASNLNQALLLNPQKSREEVTALLEVQNIRVSIEDSFGLIIADPYETLVPSLKLYEKKSLTYRLLNDDDELVVAMTMRETSSQDMGFLGSGDQESQSEDFYIVLRKESLQDIPTINTVQFSQEGDLNSRVQYDLILERLAEGEKNFRLAIVNLPKEIDPAFLDPGSNASLTQVKFSEEVTRQQLELELQIPEQLSREFVDETLEFYVFVTDREGFQQISELNRKHANKPIPLDDVHTIKGNSERLFLIPRGQGALETIIANRYQEIKVGEEVTVRVDLLNTGTLQVEQVHTVLTPPLDWTYSSKPDTIDRILPGEKEPINITLTPPSELGVSEYDVRVEAAGYVGNEKIEAPEKDITIRVEARANIIRNALIIGAVIALVVGVAVGTIKVSRR